MKGFVKLMTAALTVGALASCTDVLETSGSQQVKEGDLTGVIQLDENTATRVAFAPASSGYVWDEDDAVRVYTLSQLVFNSYDLISGEGTNTGEFQLSGNDNLAGSTDSKYAVSEPKGSNAIYGISATSDGKAMLTATVKPCYDWTDVLANGDEGYKLPTPFWGNAQVNGSKINVDFEALTGFLKIDLRRIPMGTQALVLTSHEDFSIGGDKDDPLATIVRGGGNEPLAGTMNAVLENGGALAADTRLVSHDTLRIDFDKIEEIAGEDKIFYVPVPAQHYDRLAVLAVSEDNRAPYAWNDVDVLATYYDTTFKVGATKEIYLDAEYDIPMGVTSPKEISEIIASRYDGIHTVRVNILDQVKPIAGFDEQILIMNNAAGQNNIEIKFSQVPAGKLSIVECPATTGFGGAFVKWDLVSPYKADANDVYANNKLSKTAKQKVTLDFLAGSDQDLKVLLPESEVTLQSEEDFTGIVEVLASDNNQISGYDNKEFNKKKAGLYVKGSNTFTQIDVLPTSWKTGVFAFEDDTEILTLNMMPTQPGNLRLTDALVGDAVYNTTITGEPAIITTGAAAIKNVAETKNIVKVRAYWTAKAISDYAVENGYEGADVKDEEKATGIIYTAAQLQAVGLDKSLQAAGSAFTSGTGVLDYKISKKVEYMHLGGEMFQWIGAQIGVMMPDRTIDGILASHRELVAPVFNTTWDMFDPQKLTTDVKIDGNFVDLHNMEMTIIDPYFQDPHRCCTSCGELAVKIERDLGLVRNINTKANVRFDNFRLNDVELLCGDEKVNIPNVGSLVGRISADGNVFMEDNRATNIQIAIAGGNVGGHVGNLTSKTGNVKINKSISGLYNYDLANSVIVGGAYRNMASYAETKVYTNFVVTLGDNAGGLVGQILAPAGTVRIQGARIGMYAIGADRHNNVGGIVGNLAYGEGALTTVVGPQHESQFESVTAAGAVSMLRGMVVVDNILATENPKKATNVAVWGNTGDNVGGFAGKAYAAQIGGLDYDLDDATGKQLVAGGTVKSTNLYAGGRFAGGLIGYNYQAEAAANDHVAATFISALSDYIVDETHSIVNTDVAISELTAFNGNAGGLVGVQAMGDLVIGGGGLNKDNGATVKVAIDKLNAAYAGGGLVGNNHDDVDVCAFYRPEYFGAKGGKADCTVSAKVTAWTNTWAANQFTSKYAGESTDNLRKLCGSFDNLGGLVSEHFKLLNIAKIVTNGRIPNDTKKALYFQLHDDPINTKGVSTDPYWGDWLGYVGYANQSSFYLIEGTDHRQGDQQFNYRHNY